MFLFRMAKGFEDILNGRDIAVVYDLIVHQPRRQQRAPTSALIGNKVKCRALWRVSIIG